MNLPLLTWGSVLLLLAIIFLARMIKSNRHRLVKNHNFIEMGSEAEEFFVPGDRLKRGDYDYDEFDDI